VYQPVFSCQTCYEDQAKNLNPTAFEAIAGITDPTQRNLELSKVVEPHGVCLACSIHCHDGHDVNELYNKMDFRCDCGNSRMPNFCKIDSEKPIEDQSSKDDDNPSNVYNQTYFDIYCHCRQRHSSEAISNFMMQCHQCEDWFHNQHLLPPVLKK
jgi:hypothetical protein